MEEETPVEIPLTPEAKEAGWDATLASDPDFAAVKEGIVDADSE